MSRKQSDAYERTEARAIRMDPPARDERRETSEQGQKLFIRFNSQPVSLQCQRKSHFFCVRFSFFSASRAAVLCVLTALCFEHTAQFVQWQKINFNKYLYILFFCITIMLVACCSAAQNSRTDGRQRLSERESGANAQIWCTPYQAKNKRSRALFSMHDIAIKTCKVIHDCDCGVFATER